MEAIKIVDARMGRGKTKAALRLMKEAKGGERFLYITRYPEEVKEVCTPMGYDTSTDLYLQTRETKRGLADGVNIASPPEVLADMDGDMLNFVKQRGYTLIVDGEFDPVSLILMPAADSKLLLSDFTKVDPNGRVRWTETFYTGRLNNYKVLCDKGVLYHLNDLFYRVVNPSVFHWFKSVWLLMYMFKESHLEAYFTKFNLPYMFWGIRSDEDGPFFLKGVDSPPIVDYRRYIHLAGDPPINRWERDTLELGGGENKFTLSWYANRSRDGAIMTNARKMFYKFANRYWNRRPATLLWTTFNGNRDKFTTRRGVYRDSYARLDGMDAGDRTSANLVAMLVNVYYSPQFREFYRDTDVHISDERFALVTILNFLWRSALRLNKPIVVYLPSLRMRAYLKRWMRREAGDRAPVSWIGIEMDFPGIKVAYDRADAEQRKRFMTDD